MPPSARAARYRETAARNGVKRVPTIARNRRPRSAKYAFYH